MHLSLGEREDDKTSTNPTSASLRCVTLYSALLSRYMGINTHIYNAG